MGKKTELQVEIIQENPLIVKGVDTQVIESQPEETLASRLAETLEARVGGSTSGLTAKEKCVVPVVIVDSPPTDSGRHHVEDTVHTDPEARVVDDMQMETNAQGVVGPPSQSAQLVVLQDIEALNDHSNHVIWINQLQFRNQTVLRSFMT
ncbi:OLC1v1024629C1 [Oldenlandia corymbosa var. corymbosa]|uniref:OLC1v1024629C1 n=1 Tax=Oldenlandia corymbosa var. corymbosa TaxID=529605 RepID=A0AAV1C390_OLDCO|nr:OLC1v1024629C1 [Oldenlandia corymbosa var. corymbosa]